MKWFKHHSDMSLNDKIGRLEAKYGLIGYAVYLKVLEICALNWDEISDPKFQFNYKRLLKVIGIQSKKGKEIVNFCTTIDLFSISICKESIEIYFPKLAKIKKRYEKKSVAATNETRGNRTPNKKGEEKGEENKEQNGDDDGALVEKIKNHDLIKINDEVFAVYEFNFGYPRNIFDEFARDAWPLYVASDDPRKNWKRFLTHYLKNSKPQIEDRLREIISDKPYSKILSDIFKDEVANV